MWLAGSAAIAITLATCSSLAQTAIEIPKSTAPTTQAVAESQERAWSFSISAYTYFVPNDHEYVQPTFTADHESLDLEARYNYEDQNTASAWVGYNFIGGDKLGWQVTPMIGGVFGDTTGVAPGYKGSVSWKRFELYSEGEYVFDAGDSSNSFFYNWSELTFSPTDWLRFGVVTQRTRAYQSDRDIQRGLLVGFTYKQLDLAAYVFNPDDSEPIIVVAVRFDF
jgi:hypothetical protein